MSIKTRGWLYVSLPTALFLTCVLIPVFIDNIAEPFVSFLSALYAVTGFVLGIVIVCAFVIGINSILDSYREKQSH